MENNNLYSLIKIIITFFFNEHYRSKEEFTLHMQCHNIERPYICTYCDKRYAYKTALKKHKVIHTKETLFSDSEYAHHSGYECKNCGLTFRFANALVKHAYLIHKNEKPFACSLCTSCFPNKRNLDRHVKSHKSQQGDLNNNVERFFFLKL